MYAEHKMNYHRNSWLVTQLTTKLLLLTGCVIPQTLNTTVCCIYKFHPPLVCVSKQSCSWKWNTFNKNTLENVYFATGIICKCFFSCSSASSTIWQAFYLHQLSAHSGSFIIRVWSVCSLAYYWTHQSKNLNAHLWLYAQESFLVAVIDIFEKFILLTVLFFYWYNWPVGAQVPWTNTNMADTYTLLSALFYFYFFCCFKQL